jgi:S-adenosylhomocysteine hydrolase
VRPVKTSLQRTAVPVTLAIDQQIAREKLPAMGADIDKLTPAQKKYLASSELGT